MKCPMLMIEKGYSPMFQESRTDCIQSECAWFDNEQKQCAVLSININLIKSQENK